jgi:hypothetical protein
MSDPSRRVEYVQLDDVRPADRNPKTHDHETLRRSFERFGFVEPMIRDDRTGRLVAGHGRLDELRMARSRDGANPPEGVELADDGVTWLVPVLTGWSSSDDEQAQAYVVASNRLVELGGWDESILTDVLDSLSTIDGGLDGIGYSVDDALAMVSKRLGEIDEDAGDASPKLDGMTYRLIVDCDDEAHQAELLEQLDALGLSVRAVVN